MSVCRLVGKSVGWLVGRSPFWACRTWYIDFKGWAHMDALILVRDLDRAVPPIAVDQDLDVSYDRLYCGKTTLQDSDLNINQYPVAF